MFIPAPSRIEVKPLKKIGVIMDTKDQLVEMGEVVSLGKGCEGFFLKIGDIVAFEGWGCTKITYKGEDKWLVKADPDVVLGKYDKE